MVKPGDVFSIEVEGGAGYFQFVLKHELMGELIRVFPGAHASPPGDFDALVSQLTNFWIFFPVAAALRRKIVKKEGNYPIPSHSQELPLFRTGTVNQQTKRVDDWWLWDGNESWRVGSISDGQRRLPIRGSWNDTLLKERIAKGWLPELDPR